MCNFYRLERNILRSPHVAVSLPSGRLTLIDTQRSDPASCFKGRFFRKQSTLMWNFKNKCCIYRGENAAQATWLPLVLGVKHVQAPLGGPSVRLTSFNEATRPTARRARNNNVWHHYSQLKYLQSCVEIVGNIRRVEGNMSKKNENVHQTYDKIRTLNIALSKELWKIC